MAATVDRTFELIRDNYLYIFYNNGEDGEYVLIPSWPDQLQDNMQSNFTSQNALARSAPIWSYQNSGPRSVSISVELHRDMFDQINFEANGMKLESLDEDYVDTVIKKLQSISVPKYNATAKAVQPPMVAVRFGNELFIKGIVSGNIKVTYDKPILSGNRYAKVTIGFTIYETDPYDAETVNQQGSFRGITKTFMNSPWSKS